MLECLSCDRSKRYWVLCNPGVGTIVFDVTQLQRLSFSLEVFKTVRVFFAAIVNSLLTCTRASHLLPGLKAHVSLCLRTRI